MLRRLLVCLAFATWCFLNTWVHYANGGIAYFARDDPFYAVVVPVICCEAVITLALAIAWEVCRRASFRSSPVPHLLFLGSCFVPFGIAAVALLAASPVDLGPLVRKPLFWPVALAAAVVPVAFAALHPRRASRAVRALFLYSWPVLAIILIQAGRSTLFRYPASAYADGPLAPPLNGPLPGVRVIWIIFDELSQTIAFANRPPGLDLPNFDRLRAESFYATAASSPFPATEVSLPALILGQRISSVTAAGPNDLEIQSQRGSKPFSWSAAPNVFDRARQLGLNTALAGWDHPYGRVLNRSLTKCYWTPGWLVPGVEERFEESLAERLPETPEALASAIWFRVKLQIADLPLVGHIPGMFPGVYQREDKAPRFSYLLDRAREIVSDPSIGLALIHLQVPHPPGIYNRSTGAFTTARAVGYVDNVALADLALGDLRRALQDSGLASRTAIVVSADHGWRTGLWRRSPEWTPEEEAVSHQDTSGVPFLVSLPGQTSGSIYTQEFNTVITSRLILDILSGSLRPPADVAETVRDLQHQPGN